MRVSLPSSLLSLVALALAAPPGSLDPVLDLALLARTQRLSDDVIRRASPDSPTNGYAPGSIDCPSVRPSIRSAATVSTNESDWLTKRRQNTLTDLTTFLTASNITDFDVQSFISSHQSNMSNIPNIGIAVSGGGYRALLNGAGFIAAADSRTPGSSAAMGIGGLLQSSTYLAGLSGGGWLVGSIYANNFSTVVKLRDGTPGSSIVRILCRADFGSFVMGILTVAS
jgi:lysophospholipase